MSDKGNQVNEETSSDGDGYATCSKFTHINPERISHNTQDLNGVFDYNSADDVRQALKGVFTGKYAKEGETFTPIGFKDKPLETKSQASHTGPSESKSILPKLSESVTLGMTRSIPDLNSARAEVNSRAETFSSVTRKRPGRPPKAGPSKKIKKFTVTELYHGKLSNLMSHCRSDSDSDSDTLLF